jgi:hypothetical protein
VPIDPVDADEFVVDTPEGPVFLRVAQSVFGEVMARIFDQLDEVAEEDQGDAQRWLADRLDTDLAAARRVPPGERVLSGRAAVKAARALVLQAAEHWQQEG